jgi:hypothetical protein
MLSRVAVLILSISGALCAQEFRGAISGSVTDPAGAAIAGANVSAVETRTGAKSKTVTDNAGEYTIPFLPPGVYEITAEGHGFKRYVRQNVQLGSGDHPVLDIRMEVGAITQSIEVAESVSLVNSENASVGQTITTKQVEDFPLNGRTPMMLAQLSIGVIATAQPSLVHPFDNSGAAAWSIGGTPAQTSELLMDGSPDATWDNRLAYSPPQDAVQEVTVKAFDNDAAYGHTGSGHRQPDYEDWHKQLPRIDVGIQPAVGGGCRELFHQPKRRSGSGDAFQSIWPDGGRAGADSETV